MVQTNLEYSSECLTINAILSRFLLHLFLSTELPTPGRCGALTSAQVAQPSPGLVLAGAHFDVFER